MFRIIILAFKTMVNLNFPSSLVNLYLICVTAFKGEIMIEDTACRIQMLLPKNSLVAHF